MKPTLPSTWRWVPLGDLLEHRRDLTNPADEPDASFNSVGLEDITGDGVGEVAVQTLDGSELASAKAIFSEGELLYGRLRPYLNKVAIAPCDGVCSTEIWVFRATPLIDLHFAFLTIISPLVLDRVCRITQGANLPRVEADAFDRLEIPLPPLSEQRRIVGVLDEARAVRRLRRQADDLTAQLIPAIFHDMFGDPIGNAPSSERTPVRAFVKQMQGGKSLGEDPSGTRHRVVKVSAVTWGRFQPNESKFVDDDYEPPADHYVKAGDLLFSRANTNELVGATVLVTEQPTNVLLSDKIWRFVWKRPDQVEPFYMLALFQHPSVRWEIGNLATGTGGSMKNISKGKLMSMRVQIAPVDRQREFARLVKDIAALHVDVAHDESLTASLLAHAFSGELTAKWREAHQDELAREAAERDAALKTAGVKLAKPVRPTMGGDVPTTGRYAELNREQRELFRQAKLAADAETSGGAFTIGSMRDWLEEPLDDLPDDALRRHLEVLVARGLMKLVSRPLGAASSSSTKGDGRSGYGNLYRLVREKAGEEVESELFRMSELSRMARSARAIHVSVSDRIRLSNTVDAEADDNDSETGD